MLKKQDSFSFWAPVTNFHKILILVWLCISFYIGYKSDPSSSGSIINMIIVGAIILVISYPVSYFLFWILIRDRQENEGFSRFAKDVGKAILASVAIIASVVVLFLGYVKISELITPKETSNNIPENISILPSPTPQEYVENDLYDPKGKMQEPTKFVFDYSTINTHPNPLYDGYLNFSASLHNNTSYDVYQLYITTYAYKAGAKSCDKNQLIDTQSDLVSEFIPAGGVKMITIRIGGPGYLTGTSYCTEVTKASIRY